MNRDALWCFHVPVNDWSMPTRLLLKKPEIHEHVITCTCLFTIPQTVGPRCTVEGVICAYWKWNLRSHRHLFFGGGKRSYLLDGVAWRLRLRVGLIFPLFDVSAYVMPAGYRYLWAGHSICSRVFWGTCWVFLSIQFVTSFMSGSEIGWWEI